MIQLSTRWWRGEAVAAVAMLVTSFGPSAASAAEPATGPAANATGINIRVPREPVAFVGMVSAGSAGTPAAHAMAYAIDRHGRTAGHAEADASGMYRLVGLRPGDYRIAAGPGFIGDPMLQRGFYRAGTSGHFTLSPADATVLHYDGHKLTGKNITLPVGYTLRGRIARAATGAGVGNVFVSAEVPGAMVLSSASATTDAAGRYQLTGLSHRSYRLRVNALLASPNVQSGCYQPTGAIHFTADCSSAPTFALKGDTTGVNVALPRGLTVSGSVVDRASSTPLCASVSVVPPGSTDALSSDNACGSFMVDHLSPGTYQLTVYPQSGGSFVIGAYNSGNPNLWVPDGSPPTTFHLADDLNLGIIRPAEGHVVSGHVRDTAGHPLPFVGVTISGLDGWCCGFDSTAANGSFRIAGLANRRYVVRFDPIGAFQSGWYDADLPRGFSPWRANATEFMLPADRPGMNVRLPHGYSISGRITDAAGHGVYSYLGSVGDGAPRGGHPSDSNGFYTIKGFAPGRYRIMVIPAFFGAVPFQTGWYSATAPGHFTPNRRDATRVHVGP
jgi:hypothetical protein